MSLFNSDEPVTTHQVVETFLKFFTERDHFDVGGSSIVPVDDPSLLFINSGMAPMKPYFLGQTKPPRPNLCNVQACVRTNDIESVGDRHHLTFFEMLGSWSIGNYWKGDAIRLALQLLTDGFGFPIERLYATVYAGEPGRSLPRDEDSASHWIAAGLTPEQIVPLGEDNFWGPAGTTGPCGPCTEVFFDTGERFGPKYVPGGHFDDKSRYIEIWNAGVFMQYNLTKEGIFEPLETRCVDTGSGLERMVMTLNGRDSVYEVDTMAPVLDAAAKILGGDDRSANARIICDHVRAGVHIIAEGVLPSNSGAGYIPRRLIRRSMAVLRQAGCSSLDLSTVVEAVFQQIRPWSRLTDDQFDSVLGVVQSEQAAFESALSRGLKVLAEKVASRQPPSLTGEEAFHVFSTYGLPIDTIGEFLEHRGGVFDKESFTAAMEQHQEVSRARVGRDNGLPEGLSGSPATSFEGLECTSGEGSILALIRDGAPVLSANPGDGVELLLDRTVFYPEGGGQVGDRGSISTPGAEVAILETTKTDGGHILHRGTVTSGTLRPGEVASLEVDPAWRAGSRVHHSATHLLNAALRKVLGDHVRQRGSLVRPDRLRFDFDHPQKVSEAELRQIENLVNEVIRLNYDREAITMPYQEAIASGAEAMFAEKYGRDVRVIRFGPASIELCGGMHVGATGELGCFVIDSEAAAAQGIRRISALAGKAAFAKIQQQRHLLSQVTARLGGSEATVLEQLERRTNRAKSEEAPKAIVFEGMEDKVKTLANGTRALMAEVTGEVPELRDAASDFADKIDGVVCLVSPADGAQRLVVSVAVGLSGSMPAGAVLKSLLPIVDGKGGGNARLAMGGGKKVVRLAELQKHFVQVMDELVSHRV